MSRITKQMKIDHLRHARRIADIFSKDDSTKVGAIIIDPVFGEIIPYGTGYNGLPRGCRDDMPERKERPEKYLWTEHAERNAIFNVARTRLNKGVAVLSYMPDIVSARALVSCGVTDIVVLDPEAEGLMDFRVPVLFQEASVRLITDGRNLLSAREQGHKILKYAELAKSEEGKQAAILLSEDGRILSDVHNRPEGAEDAARTAIYNVARYDTQGCILVATMMPCSECAEAVIQSGISAVVTERPDIDRWNAHFDKSASLFAEAGIVCEIF